MAFQRPDERRIRLWDVFANRELASLESAAWPEGRNANDFSPDGRVFAVSRPDEIKFWESGTGKHIGALALATTMSIAFSPDGRLFAASATSAGETVPAVTLWKMPTLTEVAKLPGQAIGLTFSQDGQTLAVILADTVILWDVPSQVVHASLKPLAQGARYSYATQPPNGFSPDGKLFAIADDMHMRLWNTVIGELVGLPAGPRESTRALAWSPDGKTLATSSGPRLRLWNVATREELATLMSANRVGCHAFALDGSLVVGNQMYKIRVWRTGLDQNAR